VPVSPRIECMECGGEASLVQPLSDDDELEPGDVVTYRCRDCGQRLDVVVVVDDLDG